MISCSCDYIVLSQSQGPCMSQVNKYYTLGSVCITKLYHHKSSSECVYSWERYTIIWLQKVREWLIGIIVAIMYVCSNVILLCNPCMEMYICMYNYVTLDWLDTYLIYDFCMMMSYTHVTIETKQHQRYKHIYTNYTISW